MKVGDGTRDIRLNANHGSEAVVGTVGAHDFHIITGNAIRFQVSGSNGQIKSSGSIATTASFGRVEADDYNFSSADTVGGFGTMSGSITSTGSFGSVVIDGADTVSPSCCILVPVITYS